jgi:hypothetical protein
MIVKLLCIIIFITYCIISAMLSYYFIKKRSIWDSLFSLESLYNSIRELIVCPEHFIIWIPCVEFKNTECSNKRKTNNDARIQIKKILEHIINIMKNISILKSKSNSNSKHTLEKIKWVLEGTMKDYDRMYDENAEFYNNLANSYEILNEKCKKKNDKEDNEDKENYVLQLSLEDLVILENNIEVCENVSNILSIFSDSEYKLLNQIESGYMNSLLYDLIENIRIYKIICLIDADK